MNKVRYYGDRKLPFQLLKDIPRILEKGMQTVNQHKFDRIAKKQKAKTNELQKFVKNNQSGMNNILVYVFWIVVSTLFNDYEHISFPNEFMGEIRLALQAQYREMYFNYLLRMKQHISDGIQEILPFLISEIIMQAIIVKLKNHGLPLKKSKTQILIIGIIFRELYGYETSQLSLEIGYKKYILQLTSDGRTSSAHQMTQQQPN